MIRVAISGDQPRRWNPFRRRGFVFNLPTGWAEVHHPRRWFARVLTNGLSARDAFLRSLIPLRYRWQMNDEDWNALRVKTEWMEPKGDCRAVPVPFYVHRGTKYIGPMPEGANIACGEFAVADDLYGKAVEGDTVAATQLAAVLYRQNDTDAWQFRGDERMPFRHLSEADERVKRQKQIPGDVIAAGMLYMSGLKAWMADVYGAYLFDTPDEPEENDTEAHQEDAPSGPDFKWWGVFQGVAEAGVFGTLDKVYQANIHEVCIFLVRKKIEHEKIMAATKRTNNADA